jgi:hypothetical protein
VEAKAKGLRSLDKLAEERKMKGHTNLAQDKALGQCRELRFGISSATFLEAEERLRHNPLQGLGADGTCDTGGRTGLSCSSSEGGMSSASSWSALMSGKPRGEDALMDGDRGYFLVGGHTWRCPGPRV